MKFVIARDTVELDYKSDDFWRQYDEIEVECPQGWVIRYIEGGIVKSFGYSQSSGHDEYLEEYREDTFNVPLAFTEDARANAALMHKGGYNNRRAKLVRVL